MDPGALPASRTLQGFARELTEAIEDHDGPESRRLVEDIKNLAANIEFLLIEETP